MRDEPKPKPRPPLDEEGLERLGIFYAGRYATTRARLKTYFARKLRERGWAGTGQPPLDLMVERFAELGYVSDSAFASAKAGALLRRGYGERRLEQALHAAGVEEQDSAAAREAAREGAWGAALRFAERRRLGPFASAPADFPARNKAVAAMLRAGHPIGLVHKLLGASPGDIPDPDL